MYHLWFHRGWSPAWENLDVSSNSVGPGFKFGPGVTSSTKERIDVFGVGFDNAMHYMWFHPSTGWSPEWENLGSLDFGVQFNSNIAACFNRWSYRTICFRVLTMLCIINGSILHLAGHLLGRT